MHANWRDAAARTFTYNPAPAHQRWWGAISHKRRFADPYDAGVPYYLYNLATPDAYDHIFICHEHPANAALRETAATLDARLLHLRAKRDKT